VHALEPVEVLSTHNIEPTKMCGSDDFRLERVTAQVQLVSS